MTAVASPRANGQVERFNRTVLDSLATYVENDHGNGDVVTPTIVKDINNIRENSIRRSSILAKKAKERFDRNRRNTDPLKIGDKVLVERKIIQKGLRSGKLMSKYDKLYIIKKVFPHDRYLIESIGRRRNYKNVYARDKLKIFENCDVESINE